MNFIDFNRFPIKIITSDNTNINTTTQIYNEAQIEEIVKKLLKQYSIELKQNTLKITYSNDNPTINVNLPVGSVWINKTTGEVFICVDDTPNRNVWVGSFGTIIEPSEFFKVDIFNDNSIIAFYRFNYSTNDETGIYHGYKLGAASYAPGIFDRAIDLGEIPHDMNGFLVKNIPLFDEMSFSLWVYKYSNNQINPYISLAYQNIYNGILLYENNGYFKIIINNKIYVFSKSKYIPTKTWKLISLNILKNPVQKVELFIDGEFIDEIYYINDDFVLSKYSLNNCLILGQDQDTYCGGFEMSQSFMGKFDHFRIFSRPLTHDEHKILYNEREIQE